MLHIIDKKGIKHFVPEAVRAGAAHCWRRFKLRQDRAPRTTPLSEDKLQHAIDLSEEQKYKRKTFVQWVARQGLLTPLLSPTELNTALHQGILPKTWDIHHYIPRKFNGSNQTENFCIMERTLHNILHECLWAVVWQNSEPEKIAYIALPPPKLVFTMADIGLFFTPEEIACIQKISPMKKHNIAQAPAFRVIHHGIERQRD